MPIVLTGTKTVNNAIGPETAANLTTIMATAVEQLTVAQVRGLVRALDSLPHGNDPGTVIGAIVK